MKIPGWTAAVEISAQQYQEPQQRGDAEQFRLHVRHSFNDQLRGALLVVCVLRRNGLGLLAKGPVAISAGTVVVGFNLLRGMGGVADMSPKLLCSRCCLRLPGTAVRLFQRLAVHPGIFHQSES